MPENKILFVLIFLRSKGRYHTLGAILQIKKAQYRQLWKKIDISEIGQQKTAYKRNGERMPKPIIKQNPKRRACYIELLLGDGQLPLSITSLKQSQDLDYQSPIQLFLKQGQENKQRDQVYQEQQGKYGQQVFQGQQGQQRSQNQQQNQQDNRNSQKGYENEGSIPQSSEMKGLSIHGNDQSQIKEIINSQNFVKNQENRNSDNRTKKTLESHQQEEPMKNPVKTKLTSDRLQEIQEQFNKRSEENPRENSSSKVSIGSQASRQSESVYIENHNPRRKKKNNHDDARSSICQTEKDKLKKEREEKDSEELTPVLIQMTINAISFLLPLLSEQTELVKFVDFMFLLRSNFVANPSHQEAIKAIYQTSFEEENPNSRITKICLDSVGQAKTDKIVASLIKLVKCLQFHQKKLGLSIDKSIINSIQSAMDDCKGQFNKMVSCQGIKLKIIEESNGKFNGRASNKNNTCSVLPRSEDKKYASMNNAEENSGFESHKGGHKKFPKEDPKESLKKGPKEIHKVGHKESIKGQSKNNFQQSSINHVSHQSEQPATVEIKSITLSQQIPFDESKFTEKVQNLRESNILLI